jgi:hypothetical protein
MSAVPLFGHAVHYFRAVFFGDSFRGRGTEGLDYWMVPNVTTDQSPTVRHPVGLFLCSNRFASCAPTMLPKGQPAMTDSADDRKVVRPNFTVHQGVGNHIEPMGSGGFMVFWRGAPVYENGRIRRFQAESAAREFLARCDAVGKIIH